MKHIHIISHTHWDREWYQTFQQFRLRLVHLTDRLLALLESDPAYLHFMLDGQTIVLEDYLQMRPHQTERLRSYIQSGRLLIGPWYILPDEFLVSPEATVRNLLIGKEICTQFGGRMMIGYIPDPFGHIGQMPQILNGFGIRTACFWRGLSDEPCELNWQAPDGSQVFTLYLRDSYGNGAGLPTAEPQRFSDELSRAADSLINHSATARGTGHAVIMMGTDHMEPPMDTSSALAAASQRLSDTKVIHSTLPTAIDAIQTEIERLGTSLPTIHGELRSSRRMPLLPGVLSARMWIKQRNQASETLLERWAEPFSAWASAIAPSSPLTSSTLIDPAPILHQAWKLLIQCHPHDSICGCSIDQVHDEMRPRFDQVDQVGEEITRQALEAIAGQADTRPPASLNALSALVVFNPTSHPLTDTVSTVLDLPSSVTLVNIVDQTGKVLPHQILGQGNKTLFAATLDGKGLEESANMIHEGRVAGMVVREMHIRREASTVHADLVLAETGEPNLHAWEEGSTKLHQLAADPTVQTFNVSARTAQAAKILFTAPDVPGLGYKTFWICPRQEAPPPLAQINPMLRLVMPLAARIAQQPVVQKWISGRLKPRVKIAPIIENEFLKVEASATDGTLTLTDKRSGMVFTGLNRFIDGGDCGDEYNYAPPVQDALRTAHLRHVDVEMGEAQQTFILNLILRLPLELAPDRKSRSDDSVILPIICRVTLHHNVPRLDIQTEVENTARDHRLRVHFPAPFRVDHFNTDGHYEVRTRPITSPVGGPDWVEEPRPEMPQRAFSTLSDEKHGLTLANLGLPEIEALQSEHGSELALTLLRCVGWLSRDDFSTRKGHAGPFLPTPGAQEPGHQVFRYALIPHTGGWETAEPLVRGFESPMRVVSRPLQSGKLPAAHSLVTCTGALQITCIKTSEDGKGMILRGWAPQQEKITLHSRLPLKSIYRAMLDETPLSSVPFSQPDSCELEVRQNEIITLLLETA